MSEPCPLTDTLAGIRRENTNSCPWKVAVIKLDPTLNGTGSCWPICTVLSLPPIPDRKISNINGKCSNLQATGVKLSDATAPLAPYARNGDAQTNDINRPWITQRSDFISTSPSDNCFCGLVFQPDNASSPIRRSPSCCDGLSFVTEPSFALRNANLRFCVPRRPRCVIDFAVL